MRTLPCVSWTAADQAVVVGAVGEAVAPPSVLGKGGQGGGGTGRGAAVSSDTPQGSRKKGQRRCAPPCRRILPLASIAMMYGSVCDRPTRMNSRGGQPRRHGLPTLSSSSQSLKAQARPRDAPETAGGIQQAGGGLPEGTGGGQGKRAGVLRCVAQCAGSDGCVPPCSAESLRDGAIVKAPPVLAGTPEIVERKRVAEAVLQRQSRGFPTQGA